MNGIYNRIMKFKTICWIYFLFVFCFYLTTLWILEFQSRQSFDVLSRGWTRVIRRQHTGLEGGAMLVLIIISLFCSNLITKTKSDHVEARSKFYIIGNDLMKAESREGDCITETETKLIIRISYCYRNWGWWRWSHRWSQRWWRWR